MFSFSNLIKGLGGLFSGRSHADQKVPLPGARVGGLQQTPLANGSGNTAAAAAAMSHFAEGSTQPVPQTQEQQQQQVDRVEAQVENDNTKLEKQEEQLPSGDAKDSRDALREDWRKARDPKTPMTEAEFQALEQRGKELGLDPKNTRPEDVLRDRGVPESAIDTLKNAGNIDAQVGATNRQPDLQDLSPEKIAETHLGADKKPLQEMDDKKLSDVVTAQAALSEDIKEGADVRKAVTNTSALDMLSGGRTGKGGQYLPGGMDALRGDFGMRRNTEGQTSTEIAETLGLDYQHSSNEYVEWKDPKNLGEVNGWSNSVKNEGIVAIDTTMNAEMVQKAQVPLGFNVMEEAKEQARTLQHENAERAALGQPLLHVPPLLRMTDDGKMAHAFERNRTSNLDPRTGLGNSVPEQAVLNSGSENVNTVNQEMKVNGAATMDAGKDEEGKNKTQMNVVDPTGQVINLANLVPVTDADGKPVLGPDGKPKTRWALNTNVGDDVSKGQIPGVMLETWKERLYFHQQAQTAAATKMNAQAKEKWLVEGKPESEFVPPSQLPEAIPELDGYKPPERK